MTEKKSVKIVKSASASTPDDDTLLNPPAPPINNQMKHNSDASGDIHSDISNDTDSDITIDMQKTTNQSNSVVNADASTADTTSRIILTPDEQLAKAKKIAYERHANQLDKGGNPYINHPKYVAEHVNTVLDKTVAWLHDTIEDTGYTVSMMRADGFDDNVITAVQLLTHKKGEPYLDYIKNLASNETARNVKIADLHNNMDLTRLPVNDRNTDDVKHRMNKYTKALSILTNTSTDDKHDVSTTSSINADDNASAADTNQHTASTMNEGTDADTVSTDNKSDADADTVSTTAITDSKPDANAADASSVNNNANTSANTANTANTNSGNDDNDKSDANTYSDDKSDVNAITNADTSNTNGDDKYTTSDAGNDKSDVSIVSNSNVNTVVDDSDSEPSNDSKVIDDDTADSKIDDDSDKVSNHTSGDGNDSDELGKDSKANNKHKRFIDNKHKKNPDDWLASMKWINKHPISSVLLAVLLCAIAFLMVRPSAIQSIPSNEGFALLKDSKAVEQVQVQDYTQTVILKLKDDYTRKTDNRNVGKTVSFGWTIGQREELGKILDKSEYDKGYSVIGYKSNTISNLFVSLLPVIIIIGFMVYLSKDGGLSGISGSQGDEKMISDKPDITFKDVAGEDTALIELKEIKDMLAEPEKYEKIGAKLPKGVLLYGPPGTGKTLLAKALAGEVDANFYYCAASDLVEMFVGLGARRVRNLFAQARKNPGKSIIFFDEIDAIGGSRSNLSEGNSEREQTLNQLLVEMDGFESTGDIIVLASTNRVDMLDKALLRPGRFDRQIGVDLPDMKGREEILAIHARNKQLADDVDLHWVAQNTAGFSGAQLANVVNEAALMAIREGRDNVTLDDFSEGIDRTLMGPKKTTREDYKKSLKLTAYHEAGHALAAMATPGSDPVNKITILPRSNALGYTAINSDDDRTNYTCTQLYGQLNYMLGGWAAEELVFGDVSTGPSNDIDKATQLARDIITKYGFSKKLGIGVWSFDRSDANALPLSDSTLTIIDNEVSTMIHDAHDNAMLALQTNKAVLDELASKLLDKETLTTEDLQPIIAKVKLIQGHNPAPYHPIQHPAVPSMSE